MPGFMSGDGSELVGGKTPGGTGQALNLDSLGNLLTNTGGTASKAIAAGTTANTVVKSSPGKLARILVLVSSANPLNVFDNASTPGGTQIALVPANTAAGTFIDCQAPALNGITVQGNNANPGVTIFYS